MTILFWQVRPFLVIFKKSFRAPLEDLRAPFGGPGPSLGTAVQDQKA